MTGQTSHSTRKKGSEGKPKPQSKIEAPAKQDHAPGSDFTPTGEAPTYDISSEITADFLQRPARAPKPADVLALQRSIGNRATTQLLGSSSTHKSTPTQSTSETTIQRNIMPYQTWYDMSKLSFYNSRPKTFTAVDNQLKAYETAQTNTQKAAILNEIKRQIDAYISLAEPDDKRLPAAQTLKTQVENEITALGTGQVFQLWSPDQFLNETKEAGKFFGDAGKSDFQVDIVRMLNQFHSLKDPTGADLERAIGLIYEMNDFAGYWFEQYNSRRNQNREARAAGMRKFLDHLKTQLPALENKVSGDAPTGATEQEIAQSKANKVQQIKEKHVGSAESSFGKIGGWLVDKLAGAPGEKVELEVEVQIPVDPNGIGFIGAVFRFEAGTETDSTEIKGEIGITGGAKVPYIGEIKGELGGFVEAKAKTPEQAMKLISYVFYRRIRESKYIPREIGEYMWGGRTGELGHKIAERWAANVEKEVFGGEGGDEAEVTMGGYGAIGATIGDPDELGAEVKVKATSGKKYTKESIERGKGAIGTTEARGLRGITGATLGDDVGSLAFSFEGKAGPFSGGIELEVASETPQGGTASERSYKASFSAEAEIPGGAGIVKALVPHIQTVLMKIVEFIRSKIKVGKQKVQLVGASNLAGAAANTPNWINFAKGIEPEEGAESLIESSSSVGLGIEIEYSAKDGLAVQVSIEQKKEIGVNASVLKVKASKSKRIFGFKYEKGTWKLI